MEAVPRMPMLSFELKHSPEPVEFSTTLKQIIRDRYHEDPAHYNKACLELEQLRQNSVQVTHDFIGCSTLKKYYAQLQFLQSRFPLQDGGDPALVFTWEDVQSGREYSQSDIKFEQASILYNIGALHSILGAMDTRQSAEGMKVSCTHFQCAAWAFQYLRDHFGSSSMSPDMAHEILSFQIDLMLAQAQECILEKSMTDNRKSSITAKVAVQIAEFYRQALRNLELTNSEGLISSRRYKDWKRRIELKILFYQTIMFFYLGAQAEEQQKHGERLAYFTAATDKLAQCVKLAKNDISEIQESIKFTQDVVGGKYNSANKDNDFVYHEKVPAIDSLPEIKGASLVKGIAFNPNDPEVSGPDIFAKLVPIEAHEYSSLYSEEKAKLLREIGAEVEEKNADLVQFMASLNLNEGKLKSEPERLPQSILEKCAAISVRPNAVKDLVDSMKVLSGISTEVEMGLKELKESLEAEEKAEEEYQKSFGKRSTTIIIPEIVKEYEICKEQHERGDLSNMELHKAMVTHTANLKLISGPLHELEKALPSTEAVKSFEDEAIVADVQRIMGKVEEMKQQRELLHEQLRDEVHKDDITNAIVTNDGADTQTFFQKHLQKHEKVVGFLRQNMSAQDNILKALTEANARFANIRKTTTESSAQREAKIRELIHSYDVYEDLMAKTHKGLEFYKKLESNVMRLLQRCRGVLKANTEERDQLMQRFAPKDSGPSRPAASKPPSSTNLTAPSQSALPSFDGPKLKDYLPFMKPATFGPKAGQRSQTPPDSPSAYPSLPSPAPYTDGMPPGQMGNIPPPGSRSSLISPAGHRAPPMPPSGPRGSPMPPSGHRASPIPPTEFRTSPMPPAEFRASPMPPTGARSSPMPPTGSRESPMPTGPEPPYQLPDLPPGYSFVDDHTGHVQQQQQQPDPNVNRPARSNLPTRTKFESTNTVSSVDTPIISPTKDTVNGHFIHTHNIRQPLGLRPGEIPDGKIHYMPTGDQSYTQQAQMGPGPRVPFSGGQGYGMPRSPVPTSYTEHPRAQYRPPAGPPQQHITSNPQYPANPNQSGGNYGTPTGQHPVNYQQGPIQNQPGFYQPHQPNVPNPQSVYQPFSMSQSQPSSAYGQSYQQAPSNAFPPQPQSNDPNRPAISSKQPMYGQPGNTDAHQPQSTYSQQAYAGSYPTNFQTVRSQSPASSFSGQQYLPNQSAPSSIQSNMPTQPYGNQGPNVSQPQLGQTPANQLPFSIQQVPNQYSTGEPVLQRYGANQTGSTYPQQQTGHPGFNQHQASQTNSQSGSLPGHHTMPGQIPSQNQSKQAQGQSQQPGIQPQGYIKPQTPDVLNSQSNYSGQSLQGQSLQGFKGQTQPQQMQGQTQQNFQQQSSIRQPQGYMGNQSQLPNMSQAQQPSVRQSQGSVAQQHPTQMGQMSQPTMGQPQISRMGQPQHTLTGWSGQPAGQTGQPAGQTGQPAGQTGQPAGQTPMGQTHQMVQQQQLPMGNTNQIHMRQPQQQLYMSQSQQTPSIQSRQTPAGQPQQTPMGQVQQTSMGQGQHTPIRQGQQTPMGQGPRTHMGQGQQTSIGQVQHTPMGQVQQSPMRQGQQSPMGQGQQTHMGQGQQTPMGQVQQTPMGQGQQTPIGWAQQSSVAQGQQIPLAQAQQLTMVHPQQGSMAGMGQFPVGYHQTSRTQPEVPGGPQRQGQFGQNSREELNQPVLQPLPIQPLEVISAASPSPQPVPVSGSLSVRQTQSHQNIAKDKTPPSLGQQMSSSTTSSFDDILSSSPENLRDIPASDSVLTPKILTAQELEQQKEEAMKLQDHQQPKDPFTIKETLDKFIGDVERFEKLVESLCKPKLSGPSHLIAEWKDLAAEQEKISHKHSMAVARCYIFKNRDPDIMPYDETRVLLKSGKDDYINASWMDDLAPSCPKFIASQGPLAVTLVDFWLMVYEQGTEVIVMLSREDEPGKKTPVYWPTEKGHTVQHGPISLTLQSYKNKSFWLERIIYLTHSETKQGRTIVHLQYLNWPVSGLPEKIPYILQFINEVQYFYKQQRSLLKPVIVHCSNGVGRTGTFLTIYVGVQEVNKGHGIIDVPSLITKMRSKRKHMITDMEHLKFCYEAILYHAQEELMKRGILTNKKSFSDKLPTPGDKSHTRKPSEDLILGSAMGLHTIESNVAKFTSKHVHVGVKRSGHYQAVENNQNKQESQTDVSDEALARTENQANIQALPDLVQQQPDLVSRPDDGQSNVDMLSGLDSGRGIRSGSEGRVGQAPGLLSGSQSLGGSPQHSSLQLQEQRSSLPPSLADLQNPNTFTLDSSTGKKRFTKASFTQKKSLKALDPSDPLSDLDPLWTIHKNKDHSVTSSS